MFPCILNCDCVSLFLFKDGSLLDVDSHILYSPLPCCVPLPGFESFRFCVSQYEEKDRILLRNLCFVLGAKFVEKLTKKVTHLLCKFTNGPKYDAACKWGIRSVTSEWIFECVKQVIYLYWLCKGKAQIISLSVGILLRVHVYFHFMILHTFDMGKKSLSIAIFFSRIELLPSTNFYPKKSLLKTKRQEFAL